MPAGDESLALHVHRGTRAVQRMVEFAPSTGGLALWVRHRDLAADAPAAAGAPTPPLVATDGHTIFYAPAFESLPVTLQCGWIAHAVLHVALRHPQRYLDLQRLTGDADLQLFNICADAIVNSTLAHLGWLQLPKTAVSLDRLLAAALGQQQDVEAALLEWDVERLYRAIDDRRLPRAGGDGEDDPRNPREDGGAGGREDGREDGHESGRERGRESGAQAPPTAASHRAREDGPRAQRARSLGAAGATDLVPSEGSGGAPEDEAQAAREWSERLQRAHAGDGALSMLRALIADLPRSRTPWEQALRSQLAHGLAQRPSLSWSRPTRSYIANQGRAGPGRRLPWEPGRSATRPVPRLAVVVDISGSIDDGLLQRFATEIEAISRRLEAPLVMIVGDDRVRRVEHYEPGRSDLRGIAFTGGGGTDFTPLLEEADRHRPDIAVVLTDLQGPARHRPRCPVIWAVPETPQAGAAEPFGRLLALR